jgi:hypothetical protein
MQNVIVELLTLKAVSTLTIAAGVVTPTADYHAIDTEAAAASDDLDTITAPAGGVHRLLLVRPANGARTVVLKHGTGNIFTEDGTNLTLAGLAAFALLLYDLTAGGWIVIATNVPPTSSGSTIVVRKNSGADVGTRPRLNFIEGANVTMTIADDGVDNEVDITIASSAGGGGGDDIFSIAMAIGLA